jgi:O-antigen/teichoic acid export membrane protein
MWLRAHRDLVPRFAGQFGVTLASGQAALYLVGAIGGLAAVGVIRAAQVLLGPLNILFMGSGLFAVPEASRRARSGSIADVRRTGVLLAVGLAASVIVWALVVGFLPDRIGRAILPHTWSAARALLPPVALSMVGAGLAQGAETVLRALADARRSLRGALIQGVLTILGAVTGATAGISGAAWGLAIATSSAAAGWWILAARSLVTAKREVQAGARSTSTAANTLGPRP